ncbi:Phycobilisome linker polypeptide [[Leptolyngbya] sp. PCC 7376]|uniref:phycobilisome rod-core linker polypeptide n=1 Tax=[Leptolyngbya] sp. PCC 7376 TaxID=111781 RepID=UPI00029F4879|nr:phycobilisome rod-core linker polypeptide [[Leptolyngbya] sp. PCC 7376]AFY39692.1 Phycobilisome linker polypeptide [[Leptolyngbya] sp. PCC 7376]
MTGNVSPLLASRSANTNSRPFDVSEAIELTANASVEEIQTVIRAAYRQVFGNIHLMESERLATAESQLQNGTISVREFIRIIAKSDFYRANFFETCSRYRSIELNFKHLLGRAPSSYDETVPHSHILDQQGFEAEIDSYLDSDEYQSNFGDFIVPYNRGYNSQIGQNLSGFVNNFKVYTSLSTSDRVGTDIKESNQSRLAGVLLQDTTPSIPITDFRQFLRKVFAPPKVTQDNLLAPAPVLSAEELRIRAKEEEQSQIIDDLRKQLASLEYTSNLGAQFLGQEYTLSTGNTSDGQLGLQFGSTKVQEQAKEIERLQGQLMTANSLTMIAEKRLGKWRTKMFS